LASLVPPDGFTRGAYVPDTWPGERTWPGVLFVGHEGQTEIRLVLRYLDDSYSAGSGHTSFTTARGQFSFDRTGVEDSFYVESRDTAAEVSVKLAEQVA